MVSHNAPMVSAQFIYGFTKIHDGSATIHHGGATNAHDSSMIQYAGSAITSLFIFVKLGVSRDESGCQ